MTLVGESVTFTFESMSDTFTFKKISEINLNDPAAFEIYHADELIGKIEMSVSTMTEVPIRVTGYIKDDKYADFISHLTTRIQQRYMRDPFEGMKIRDLHPTDL